MMIFVCVVNLNCIEGIYTAIHKNVSSLGNIFNNILKMLKTSFIAYK